MLSIFLTIVGVHLLNTIIVLIIELRNKYAGDYSHLFCLTIWLPIWILAYPLRAALAYRRSQGYYQRHSISLVAYIFGKRVKRKKEDDS